MWVVTEAATVDSGVSKRPLNPLQVLYEPPHDPRILYEARFLLVDCFSAGIHEDSEPLQVAGKFVASTS